MLGQPMVAEGALVCGTRLGIQEACTVGARLDTVATPDAVIGVDEDDFMALLTTEEAKKEAWTDFSRSRNWGIAGFPALIGELSDDRLALLARGWSPADLIRTRIASIGEAEAG